MRSPNFTIPLSEKQPSDYRTVRDAIGDLPPIAPGQVFDEDILHRCANHRKSTIEVIRKIPKDGGSRPAGVGPACLDRIAGFYDVYGRLAWDRPAITITHYARNPASGRFVHPDQDRGLTMREAARLQGFPDTFRFQGKSDDVFRQIGEAVPPPLSIAIASSILTAFKGETVLTRQYDGEDLVRQPVCDSYAGVIAGIKARRL
jgi:DNA (cytosine-5)-methyltransferase 1